jgi:phage tail tape-measure protein
VEVSRIIAEIDAQILKLQQARALLAGTASPVVRAGRGRPKGSKSASETVKPATRKRKLSPEGRKRIADAMKKRWAERRKQNAKG